LAGRGVLRAADREQDRDEDRGELQRNVVREDPTEVEAARQPARGAGAHGQDALLRKGSGWMRLRSSEARTRRSRSSSRPPIMRPFDATLMPCVSSDTTTTTASVCVLIESAAR